MYMFFSLPGGTFSVDHIVVDLCYHKDFAINKMLSVDEMFALLKPFPQPHPSIRRYVLPLAVADKVT